MVKYQFETYARLKPTEAHTVRYDINDNILDIYYPKPSRRSAVDNQREIFEFAFSGIFDVDGTQQEVFEDVAMPLLESCMEGYNGTIFAYGQTGSGKTYTMSGADTWELRGIIPRVFTGIFDQVDMLKDQYDFNVYASFMEIYNESAYDLLDNKHAELPIEAWHKIQLFEDLYGNLHMKNLSIHQIYSEQDGIDLLMMGNFIRQVSTTPSNLASSRSHCIFTLAFESRDKESEIVRTSKFHLVDLAGSERISKTEVKGKTLKEAKHINLSLTYLEQVIIALHDREHGERAHVPYRNSLMTTILRDSLGGNCKTVLVATLSADTEHLEETISTCRFSVRCSKLTVDVHVNEQVDINLMLQNLQKENTHLREQLARNSSMSMSRSPGFLADDNALTERDMQLCKQQVALFLDPHVEPKIIVQSKPQVNRCFQLFKEAMSIQEEMYSEQIESLKERDMRQYK